MVNSVLQILDIKRLITFSKQQRDQWNVSIIWGKMFVTSCVLDFFQTLCNISLLGGIWNGSLSIGVTFRAQFFYWILEIRSKPKDSFVAKILNFFWMAVTSKFYLSHVAWNRINGWEGGEEYCTMEISGEKFCFSAVIIKPSSVGEEKRKRDFGKVFRVSYNSPPPARHLCWDWRPLREIRLYSGLHVLSCFC